MTETLLNCQELLKAVNGTQIGNAPCIFEFVATDSRNISPELKTMFVPLVGEFQDGHKYIPDVLKNENASVILMNRSEYEKNTEKYEGLVKNYPNVAFICVENTLHGLQDAAEAYAEKKCRDMIRISITGSSGKTTTKELLVSICKEYFGEENVAYTKGNFNSETGLPLSVFSIKGFEKVGILEMGMNRENEIGEISKVWKSEYGIITNIGTAHIGILGSRENIAREKRKSFDYIPEDGAVFVPACDDYADFVCQNVKGKIVKYGKNVDEKISGVHFISDGGFSGTKFSVDETEITLSLPGEYNYENCLGVIALSKEIGIPAEAMKKGIEKLNHLDGRMEKIFLNAVNAKGDEKNLVILKDCYNANLDSMTKAVDFVCKIKTDAKKILVLADMKELGDASEKSHENIGKEIVENKPDVVILIGPEMEHAYRFIKNANYEKSVFHLNENIDEYVKDACELIMEIASENDVILLKGSHSMALEKIVNELTEQSQLNLNQLKLQKS